MPMTLEVQPIELVITESMKGIVGYDMDGVICEARRCDKTFREATAEERRSLEKIKEFHSKNAKLIRKPEKPFVIITSRKTRLPTLEWLQTHSVAPEGVFFMDLPRTRENMIIFKARIINQLELIKYFEDDVKIAKKLRALCPNTQVIAVEAVVRDYSIKEFSESYLQI